MGNFYGAEYQRQQKGRMIAAMLVSVAMMGVAAYEGWRIQAEFDYILVVTGVFALWFVLALFSYLHAARKLRALEDADGK